MDGDTPKGGDRVMNPLVPDAMDDSVGGKGEGVSAQGVGVMDPPPHPPPLLGDPVRVKVRDTLMVPPPPNNSAPRDAVGRAGVAVPPSPGVSVASELCAGVGVGVPLLPLPPPLTVPPGEGVTLKEVEAVKDPTLLPLSVTVEDTVGDPQGEEVASVVKVPVGEADKVAHALPLRKKEGVALPLPPPPPPPLGLALPTPLGDTVAVNPGVSVPPIVDVTESVEQGVEVGDSVPLPVGLPVGVKGEDWVGDTL